MSIKYTAAIDTAGDEVISHAGNIQQAGKDMFDHLRNLIGTDQLNGEGIAQSLDTMQTRWNNACEEFAQKEREFGMRTKDSYSNMIATDRRGGSLIA